MSVVDEQEVKRGIIRARMDQASLMEQLAEEASELTHAALKMARLIRGESPSPMPYHTAMASLIEEFTDVALVAEVMGLDRDWGLTDEKIERWLKRLEEGTPKN